MNLYEILVPTKYGDTQKPISTKHHKEWDKRVRTLTGGLTILTPAKGQFVYENSLLKERIIPVRIMCEESIMQQIVQLTINTIARRQSCSSYSLREPILLMQKEPQDDPPILLRKGT